MTPDQEKRCRLFRLEPHLRKSAIMFLRIKFQSHRRGPRYSMDWQYDSFLRRQVYRIDFGMAKVLKRLKSLRALCGTPYYTAPEVIRGDYSHAADMWSIVVIAYVMVFAMPPFYISPNKFFGAKETKEIYKLILKGFTPEIKVISSHISILRNQIETETAELRSVVSQEAER